MNDSEIKFLPLNQIFEYANSIEFIVLPRYFLKSNSSEFCLSACLGGQFFIIDENIDSVKGRNVLYMGSLVTLYMDCGEIKLASIKRLNYKGNPRLGCQYNPGKGIKAVTAKKTNLYQGQGIVIRGGHGTGKTTVAHKLADGFEKNDFKTYRVLIGQRKEDSLGDNSINIDSASTAEYQLNKLFIILDNVFRDVHEGEDCCLVIDSIDKLITLGGESDKKIMRTLNFTHRLLQFTGDFKKGSFTLICTNNYGNTSLSKRIGLQIKSIGDAQIFLGDFATDGRLDYSRHS